MAIIFTLVVRLQLHSARRSLSMAITELFSRSSRFLSLSFLLDENILHSSLQNILSLLPMTFFPHTGHFLVPVSSMILS